MKRVLLKVIGSDGAIAQLVERNVGNVEVRSSNLLSSTLDYGRVLPRRYRLRGIGASSFGKGLITLRVRFPPRPQKYPGED